MKRKLSMLAALFILSLTWGCPQVEDAGQQDAGPGTSNVRPAEPAESRNQQPAQESPMAVEPVASHFEFQGLALGTTVDDFKQRYAGKEEFQLQERWKSDESAVGIDAFAANDKNNVSVSTWFLGDQCVGVEYRSSYKFEDFLELIEEFNDSYGPGENAPPVWAAGDKYFSGIGTEREGFENFIWGDEAGKAIMMASLYTNDEMLTVSIASLDYYLLTVDMVLSEEFLPPEDMPAPGEGIAPGLTLMEQRLESTYENFSKYFQGDNTKSVQANWIIEGEAGSISLTPIDGSALPEETAWFYDGQLVGFKRVTADDTDEFVQKMTEMNLAYGPYYHEPEPWLLQSEFGKQIKPSSGDRETLIWGNEFKNTVFIATHDFKQQDYIFELIDLERYTQVLEEFKYQDKQGQ